MYNIKCHYGATLGLFMGMLSCTTLWAEKHKELPTQIVGNKVELAAFPFAASDVTLTESWIKEHEQHNTDYLLSLDAERLLHNFRINAKLPSTAKPLEGWEAPWIGLRGHFTGHYLSALASLVERTHDKNMVQRLTYMVDELARCQQALGGQYLSAFPESDFDKLEKSNQGIWAPYYTYQKIMQGLVDCYIRAGITKALDMASAMADYVDARMNRLDKNTIERMLYTVQANPGNEAGAMSETLCKLYRASGKERHLLLAHVFDRDWFSTPLSKGKDILSGLHSNTHIVLVNGFAQRYELTGETMYRDATTHFWDMLQQEHCYANGTSSGPRPNVTTSTSLSAEHWGMPGTLSNTLTRQIAESCVTHNTQKLTSQLFTWTASPTYADAYMNTFYNAVLALHHAHGETCTYHLPLGSPRTKEFLKKEDYRCCNGSTIEAFASLQQGIYYHDDNNLWVNLYVPSRLNWEKQQTEIEIKGNFPSQPSAEITIQSRRTKNFGINLFIPSWARSAKVLINGVQQACGARPCSFVHLQRKWKAGDCIHISFDTDFYFRSMPDNDQVVALFHGPTMLAFLTGDELILKGDKKDILSHIETQADGSYKLTHGGQSYKLLPFYQVTNQSYGIYATLRND